MGQRQPRLGRKTRPPGRKRLPMMLPAFLVSLIFLSRSTGLLHRRGCSLGSGRRAAMLNAMQTKGQQCALYTRCLDLRVSLRIRTQSGSHRRTPQATTFRRTAIPKGANILAKQGTQRRRLSRAVSVYGVSCREGRLNTAGTEPRKQTKNRAETQSATKQMPSKVLCGSTATMALSFLSHSF